MNTRRTIQHWGRRVNAQGSALTEFAVVATVMVPAFMLVPAIGKISDVNTATIQASRYAAWERTLHNSGQKSDAILSVEAGNRFFAHPQAPIHTGEGRLTGAAASNPLWRMNGSSAASPNSLIADRQDTVRVQTSDSATPGAVAGTMTRAIDLVVGTMASFNPGANWDLTENGLHTARVAVNLSSNPLLSGNATDCDGQETDETFTCLQRQNVILADAWSSSNPGQVAQRVRALVPVGAFEEVGDVLSQLGRVPLLDELGGLNGAFGYVAPDVLPADRHSQ